MSEVLQDASAGTLLRRAREAAGLHVAALAVSLKVPVRKLEALERDQYDELPDAVFARALASSICRTLKVDPQPVLARLPHTAAPRLAQRQDSINAPFRAPGESTGSTWVDQLGRPVVIAVAALLVGALVIIFMPDLKREPSGAAAKAEPAGAPMAAPVVLQPAAEATSAASAGVQAPAPTPEAPASVAAADAAPAPVGGAAVPAPAATVNAATTTSTAAVADPEGVLVFRANGPSWVQVTDAKGVVTLRRLLEAGETAGASGSLPLAVTVGSASATAVQVRGKSFDLAPVTRDNVARFEVK